MNIASTNPNMESTPVLPILRVTGFSPRSVELAWLYAHKGAPKATSSSPSIMYQVSRSEHGSQAYEVVYEGSDRMCSVTELKPQTRYIFKLRIGSKLEDESLPVSWSKEYVELETSTSGMRPFISKDSRVS